MLNLFNYLLISNIFTGAFYLPTSNFQFYISYVFMILFLVFYFFYIGKFYINKVFVSVLMFMSLLSILNIYMGNNSFPSFLKQFIGFILNGLVYYSLIKLNNKIEKLFRIYLKIAIIIAVIGILQEISFLIGFKYGYDFSYLSSQIRFSGVVLGMLRVTSIFQEPAHFGAAMMPAMFISILNILKWENNFIDKKASFLIIISTLLSFSLVVYAGIIVAFILIMFNHQKARLLAVCAAILLISTFISYRYLPGIKMRVDDTVAVINGKKSLDLDSINVSSFIFYTNGFVAYKSFINNPLFGSGIGSHPISHDRYIMQANIPEKSNLYLCKEDAGSLFFRLISETGLLGILLFLYFIVKFYIPRKKDEYYWIISNSIVCLFVLNLIRNGNYFYCGFIFFIWVYYFANKNMRIKTSLLLE